jgi:SAM-dependent methyltransferase
VPERAPCPMCGSTDGEPQIAKARLLRLPHQYGVTKCRPCGFAFLSPRPAPQDLVAEYNAAEFWRPASIARFPRRQSFDARRLARLERHTGGPGTMVVMACLDGGYFLDNARHHGWQTLGVEFIDTLLDHTQRVLGLQIVRSPFWDMSAVDGKRFDAVYTHSLEHVPDPSSMLRAYHRLLRDDGILMIEAPNQFEALKERLKEAVWARLGERLEPFLKGDAPPQVHLLFFTPRTLRRALEQNGYEVLESRTYMPWNPVYHLERRGRAIRELIYLIGGLIGRGPSTEVIARRLAVAMAATEP